jgi:flagellum-specific ATP synthase
VAPGHCVVAGLSRHVRIGDFLSFRHDDGTSKLAEVVSLGPDELIACPVDGASQANIGERVWRRGPFRLSPDQSWCGRTINALGEPVDGLGPLQQGAVSRPVTGAAPASMLRQRVDKPLKTGIRVVDVFTPMCQGQRLGIFAGSGVGKSTLLSMFAKAADFDRAVVALVGERGREVREFIEDTLGPNMAKTVAVVATSDESPMQRKLAPLTAMAIAEHFRDTGENVLLIVDSLTRLPMRCAKSAWLRANRRSLAAIPRRCSPPCLACLSAPVRGRKGAGAITAIVSILVDGDNHNDPVADSARGILDGHLVLDRALADEGRYPPVNPLTSISRLARKAWRGDEEKLVMRLKALDPPFRGNPRSAADWRLPGRHRCRTRNGDQTDPGHLRDRCARRPNNPQAKMLLQNSLMP